MPSAKHVGTEFVPASLFNKLRLFCTSMCRIPVADTNDCFSGDEPSQHLSAEPDLSCSSVQNIEVIIPHLIPVCLQRMNHQCLKVHSGELCPFHPLTFLLVNSSRTTHTSPEKKLPRVTEGRHHFGILREKKED